MSNDPKTPQSPGFQPDDGAKPSDWYFNQRVSQSPLNDGSLMGQLIANSVEGVGSMVSAPDQAPGMENLRKVWDYAERAFERNGMGGQSGAPEHDENQHQSQNGPKQ